MRSASICKPAKPRHRRRVRVGQVDAPAPRPAPGAPERRRDPVRGAQYRHACWRMASRRCAAACRRYSRIRRRHSTRGRPSARSCWLPSRCMGSARSARRKQVGDTLDLVGLNARLHGALSAPAVGRPAPAHCDRARHHPATVPGRGRRADLGARRFRAGADPEPLQADPAGAGAHLSVRESQPRRHPLCQRSRRGDAPRPNRRMRHGARNLHEPAARLPRVPCSPPSPTWTRGAARAQSRDHRKTR